MLTEHQWLVGYIYNGRTRELLVSEMLWLIYAYIFFLWVLAIGTIVAYSVYRSTRFDPRFGYSGFESIKIDFARTVYRSTPISVFVLGVALTGVITLAFGAGGVVFASVLYASLFFLNETIRTDFPYLNVTKIDPNIVSAADDDRVPPDAGYSLLVDITLNNIGRGEASTTINYYVEPASSGRELAINNSASTSTESLPLTAEGTVEPVDIRPGDEETFTITVDVIPKGELPNNDQIEYHVFLEAHPGTRYSFLRARTHSKVQYPDNGDKIAEE